MLKKTICLMSVVSLVALVGCGGVPSKVGREGEIKNTIEMQRNSDYIDAIGIGAADTAIINTTQRRSLSREAAIVRAQHEMLSIIKGIQVAGDVIVEQAITTNSRLKTEIDIVIKGAEIVKSEWTADDGCIATLRLERKRLDKILKQYH